MNFLEDCIMTNNQSISLTKCFKDTYDLEMQNMNFMRLGSIYHRLVGNQIVQLLTLQRFRFGDYTIQYLIWPLCCGDEIDRHLDESRLGNLTWFYEERNDTTMAETLKICKNELFPYFIKIIDYASFMEFYKELFYKMNGIEPPILCDYNYKVNLFLGNYDLALRSREALMKQNGPMREGDTYWNGVRKKNLEEYNAIKKAIETGDRLYIESYLKKYEEFSLNSYYKNYKIRK